MWHNTLNNVADQMSYDDFLSELIAAGLSVRAFAELIGMNPNSITNYARAGVPSHLCFIAVLVAEASAQGIDFRRAMSRVDVAPKKPRGGARHGHFGGDRQNSLDLSS